MESKKVKDSRVTIIQHMTQQDANIFGNVHGGIIMKLIDNTAGIVAVRHTQKNCVTASIDRLDFHHPVFVSDLLRVTAGINFTGKTSMELGVRVESENVLTGEVKHTASAYLTFVCIDQNGKPSDVPPVVFETEDEKRRNCEAQRRRDNRLSEKKGEKNGDACDT